MSLSASLSFFLYFIFITTMSSQDNPLPACPSSPNCFRSTHLADKSSKQPMVFTGAMEAAQAKLRELLKDYKGATLEKADGPTMHYTFVTRIAKFTDDVVFFFDESNGQLHFRSASRVGWSDMGANRRRIKRIKKLWAQ